MTATPYRRRSQAGFSMVEMLMAAFILAIGLLGLAMLQTMSLRANTGSRSLTTAILIAEGKLDDIQTNGRATKLFARTGGTPPGTLTTYFGAAAAPDLTYNFAGRVLPDAIDNQLYFTLNVRRNIVVAPVSQIGGLADFTATVTWNETTVGTGSRTRQVVLTRRVGYALN